VYLLILKERPDKIFAAVADISSELALSQEGDRVRISYMDSGRPVIDIAAFDNLIYTQK
jgi:hypothetical protein